MSIIVAGRFDTAEQADNVVHELLSKGFLKSDATTFFVNPPGQHDQLPEGGDQPADANASKAHVGAATGAAAGSVAGAAAALAVPGIGPVLALGVIMKGKTEHAANISQAVTDALQRIAVDDGIPIIHGVLTLTSETQARERCLEDEINRGTEAARAAVQMVNLFSELRER